MRWESSTAISLNLLEDIEYDWHALQLGRSSESNQRKESNYIKYDFDTENTDLLIIHRYTVSFFPLYEGRSTRFGISVDNSHLQIVENLPTEFSKEWKDQVIQNSTVLTLKFPIQRGLKQHTLRLSCNDPGMIVQRIVIHWGGLKKPLKE
ncbi:hypothetical protein [Chryseobacterium taichungense]|uniref:hypothetical protein n=1 Tax=Chryseobacterium taichungense TaxID=295069 RepID=UPI0035E40C48